MIQFSFLALRDQSMLVLLFESRYERDYYITSEFAKNKQQATNIFVEFGCGTRVDTRLHEDLLWIFCWWPHLSRWMMTKAAMPTMLQWSWWQQARSDLVAEQKTKPEMGGQKVDHDIFLLWGYLYHLVTLTSFTSFKEEIFDCLTWLVIWITTSSNALPNKCVAWWFWGEPASNVVWPSGLGNEFMSFATRIQQVSTKKVPSKLTWLNGKSPFFKMGDISSSSPCFSTVILVYWRGKPSFLLKKRFRLKKQQTCLKYQSWQPWSSV